MFWLLKKKKRETNQEMTGVYSWLLWIWKWAPAYVIVWGKRKKDYGDVSRTKFIRRHFGRNLARTEALSHLFYIRIHNTLSDTTKTSSPHLSAFFFFFFFSLYCFLGDIYSKDGGMLNMRINKLIFISIFSKIPHM